jgi:hypothetical protein
MLRSGRRHHLVGTWRSASRRGDGTREEGDLRISKRDLFSSRRVLRMGPPKTFGKGGGGGGGKKGPRAHLVSHKNQQVKLRPAPEKPFVDATDSTKTSDAYPGEQSGTEDEDDEEQFGYSENLQVEVKPLAGAWICVTGCGEDKSSLLDIASELGALVENGLTDRTTHLIASESGSAKYEVSRGSLRLLMGD